VKKLIAVMLLLFAAPASAEPYRLIQARSGRQARGGNLELGLRYQGLIDGEGDEGEPIPDNFHQIAFSLRWGVIDRLELEAEASVIVWHQLGDPHADVDPGDIKLGGQVQLLRERPHILATYLNFTFPTAPSNPSLPPQFADGTFDVEALLIYELDASRFVRLIFNVGWEFLGHYKDRPYDTFDIPDAFRYDAAIALHPTARLQLSLELNGRYHTDRVITPVWINNQSILELTPGLRIEITPRWVFEGGAGIALNDDTRAMYKVHVLAGVTYEFPVY
jgi:hypothetical protein